ncbi:MAG TPA: DUF998 domain-containing protein [Ktedonobacteraceae bacterium]|nr:DUF998 domain-containing protein [Ktedonobacteraceae bacterium]
MLSRNNTTINRLLLTGGTVGPLLFILVILVEGATRPGYDAWTQAASALSLSDQGWMQITNFIVCGLLILGFAVGVRQVFRNGPGRTWGPILLAVVGAGLIIAGIFVTDPAQGYPPGTPAGPSLHTTLHGAIHFFIGGLAFFSGLPASCFVFARRFAGDTQWKGWSLYSIISSIMMIAFFVAFAIASTRAGPGGLFERISIAIGMIWMALFALRLLRQMRPMASPVRSAQETA